MMMTLEQHLIECIVGITGTIGALIILLNRFDLIHFGKKHKREIITVQECSMHKELELDLKAIHDNQIKNIEKHAQHQKRFDSGDIEIGKLKADIKQLCIGVAILLERTGGKPASFTDLG